MTPALRGFCVETRLWFKSISAVQCGEGTIKQGVFALRPTPQPRLSGYNQVKLHTIVKKWGQS
jgi:hypothetical protein